MVGKRKKQDTSGMKFYVVTHGGYFVHCGRNWSGAAMLAFVCMLWNSNRKDELVNPQPLEGLLRPLEPTMLTFRLSSENEVERLRVKYGKGGQCYPGVGIELSEPPEREPVPIEVYDTDPHVFTRGVHI